MNLDRPDALDRAIDDVARTMVSAPQDREMASLIAAALPPRRQPWFAATPRWAVHAMGAASLAAMAVIWIAREPSAPSSPDSAVAHVPAVPMMGVAPLSAAVAVSARGLIGDSRVGPAPSAPTDHERALAPVASPGSIAVAALAADWMEIAPATLEPLTIDALADGGAPPDSKEQ
jgi:hypothetical protein